jgi:hypothetical protein
MNRGSSRACCGPSPKSSAPSSVSNTAEVIQLLPAAPTAKMSFFPLKTMVGVMVLP